MEEEDIQWHEEFKVRVSSDFDRLVAFATEMNKPNQASPKREIDTVHKSQASLSDHRAHLNSIDSMQMKIENVHEYPTDLSRNERFKMMMEGKSKGRREDQR